VELSQPLAANCSLLFSELPLLERPVAARAAGFEAVEFWWPFSQAVPCDADVDGFIRAIKDAGVALIGLNFFAGDMPSGDRGILSLPDRRHEFVDNVDVVVGIADALGTKAFNALYGNRLGDMNSAGQDEVALQNLAVAAAKVAPLQGNVLLEPVSGAPDYPLLSAADAVKVIERVERELGVSNVRLLLDLYHLTVNGDDPAVVIDREIGRIGHVQYADAPGRHEPGTGGQVDIQSYSRRLAAAGYSGWMALEYVPSTTTAESLNWLEQPSAT